MDSYKPEERKKHIYVLRGRLQPFEVRDNKSEYGH